MSFTLLPQGDNSELLLLLSHHVHDLPCNRQQKPAQTLPLPVTLQWTRNRNNPYRISIRRQADISLQKESLYKVPVLLSLPGQASFHLPHLPGNNGPCLRAPSLQGNPCLDRPCNSSPGVRQPRRGSPLSLQRASLLGQCQGLLQ